MGNDTKERIARRLRSRREALGLTQDQLSTQMGFNHRQTVTAIENGQRAVSPGELASAAQVLGVEPDFFTDRYSAAGEASFSFRAEGSPREDLDAFEQLAGRWMASYRELGRESGRPVSLITPSLSLSPRSSYEDAQLAGDQVRHKLGLGEIPARDLEAALEREWGILILYVDPPEGISGVASRMEGLQAILIDRNESPGRRNYDLAHELFHILTWDAMAPPRVDSTTDAANRVEQLANNFAASLLMPESTLADMWDEKPDDVPLADWIDLISSRLGVSGVALKWRLHNLGYVPRTRLPEDDEIARESLRAGEKPQLFNASFVQRFYSAVESGALSLRRASRLLGLDTLGFADLCRSYGRSLSYEI